MFSAHHAIARPPPPPKHDYNCEVRGHPWQPVFQDLKGVALVVQVLPHSYVEAVACHGRESACADNVGVASESASASAAYIHQITDDYNAFPAPLHYDNLVRVFADSLNEKLEPFVIPEDCKRPPIAVLSTEDFETKGKSKDTVTVVVRLMIVDSIKPKVAVLSTGYFRPDEAHSDFSSQILMGHLTAIPLDLPDSEIGARVEAFAKQFRISTHENLEVDIGSNRQK